MRRKARVDSTQREIVRALERAGCRVHDTSRLGGGFPDLVVLRAGRVYLLEAKSRLGSLTKAQEAFIAQGWPVAVCWSADDALRAVGLASPLPLP